MAEGGGVIRRVVQVFISFLVQALVLFLSSGDIRWGWAWAFLGSLYAWVPGGLAALLMILRTVLEDRTLQAELEGYEEYARQVPYRLLPPIW